MDAILKLMTPFIASPGIRIGSLVIFVLYATALFLVARRLNHPRPWLAFIPIVNLWLPIEIGEQPKWLIILPFIPIVNFLTPLLIALATERICRRLGLEKFLSLVIALVALLPVIGAFVWLGLAQYIDRRQTPNQA